MKQQVMELFELAKRSRELGDTQQAGLIQQSAEHMCQEYGISPAIGAREQLAIREKVQKMRMQERAIASSEL